jgi:hypothetical protein
MRILEVCLKYAYFFVILINCFAKRISKYFNIKNLILITIILFNQIPKFIQFST